MTRWTPAEIVAGVVCAPVFLLCLVVLAPVFFFACLFRSPRINRPRNSAARAVVLSGGVK